MMEGGIPPLPGPDIMLGFTHGGAPGVTTLGDCEEGNTPYGPVPGNGGPGAGAGGADGAGVAAVPSLPGPFFSSIFFKLLLLLEGWEDL